MDLKSIPVSEAIEHLRKQRQELVEHKKDLYSEELYDMIKNIDEKQLMYYLREKLTKFEKSKKARLSIGKYLIKQMDKKNVNIRDSNLVNKEVKKLAKQHSKVKFDLSPTTKEKGFVERVPTTTYEVRNQD